MQGTLVCSTTCDARKTRGIPKLRFLLLTGSNNVTRDGIKALLRARRDVGTPDQDESLKEK